MTRAAVLEPSVWHRLDRGLARVRVHRRPLSLLIDGLVVALCWHATYLFRLGFERWWNARPSYDTAVMAAVVAVYLGVFALAGIPRGMWRFSGFGEVKRLTLACLGSGLLCAMGVLAAQLSEVPRAVLALHPFVALVGLCMVRVGYRMLYEHTRAQISGNDTEVRRAIVMGAGEAAKLLLAGIHGQGWMVVGLLDDDPAKRGARIGGMPVLGRLEDVTRPEISGAATHVIVALPGATVLQRRRAIELAAATALPVLTVPSVSELQDGSAVIERVRSIEPDDLLGRDPVQLDEAGIAELIGGKTVLVTGAGGSIGSELCRQVARFGVARLVCVDVSEFGVYQLEQELREANPQMQACYYTANVREHERLLAIAQKHRPAVVFHAAAYKHVPLMEELNEVEALRTNVLGTSNAARVAGECGARRFVMISTDKAVNPTNVMGASKRLAELIVQAVAAEYPPTQYVSVRFGNVLGSSGSVVPLFTAQIGRGGPVTVTHPEIVRYFMTIPEAAQLVLQAGLMGRSGQIFVLDMGEPVKIVELARMLIRLSGKTEQEIPITYTGLRPGEKLYEELLADDETTEPTPHPKLRVAKTSSPSPEVAAVMRWIGDAGAAPPGEAVRKWLRSQVPEYTPRQPS